MTSGKVYLVGAGPGDPTLLTLKAKQLLEQGDVVVYDRLIDIKILSLTRPDAELLDVGKERSTPSRLAQARINERLIAEARNGKKVVRLKGGDPFVFGRGGEEALALSRAKVDFEVVPGISSVVAAAAYAGIPVTHREVASTVTLVTGSEDPTKPGSPVDWPHLAVTEGTLVIVMGRQNLADIAEALVAGGKSKDTPIALVQWGTLPRQQTVVGTLGDISENADEAKLEPPIVAIVGDVVRFRKELNWYESRPLFGKRILVTRTRSQASTLSAMLTDRGAIPMEVPTISILPTDKKDLSESLGNIRNYDWIVFTSANAADAVFRQLETLGLDARVFGGTRVACIGPETAGQLREYGIIADFVPEEYRSEALVEGMGKQDMTGKRILLPKSDIGGEVLGEGLTQLGATVEQVTAYRTVTPPVAKQRLIEVVAEGIDMVTFTSSSTVRNLMALLDNDPHALSKTIVACIGPVTAKEARALGLKVAIVAREYSVPGLVLAMEESYSGRRTQDR